MCGCYNRNSVSNNIINKGVQKCPELYEILRTLDLKVLDLLTVNPSSILLDTNRQLRLWMRNLNSYCPTKDEINTVTSFVDLEEQQNKK